MKSQAFRTPDCQSQSVVVLLRSYYRLYLVPLPDSLLDFPQQPWWFFPWGYLACLLRLKVPNHLLQEPLDCKECSHSLGFGRRRIFMLNERIKEDKLGGDKLIRTKIAFVTRSFNSSSGNEKCVVSSTKCRLHSSQLCFVTLGQRWEC